jgi:hypothetical protein
MKNKDQIVLENLYKNILKESEALVDSSIDEQQKRKIVHDIMNDLTPVLFDLSQDDYKKVLETLIDRLTFLLQNN